MKKLFKAMEKLGCKVSTEKKHKTILFMELQKIDKKRNNSQSGKLQNSF